MAYIDWSDAQGLFDMLVEYVTDAKTEAHGDASREEFLAHLLPRLITAQDDAENLPKLIDQLKSIIQSVDSDHSDDPVMDHLTSSLEELERIQREKN